MTIQDVDDEDEDQTGEEWRSDMEVRADIRDRLIASGNCIWDSFSTGIDLEVSILLVIIVVIDMRPL